MYKQFNIFNWLSISLYMSNVTLLLLLLLFSTLSGQIMDHSLPLYFWIGPISFLNRNYY